MKADAPETRASLRMFSEWSPYDHRPRFGTNYYALRGRIAVLSEAYSHDPFARRVASTYAFVSELLTLVAERGPRIRALSNGADSTVRMWGAGGSSVQIPIRADLTTTPYVGDVIVETLERTTDTVRTEPGARRGMRRTGAYRHVRMPVYDRFVSTLATPAAWAFAFSGADSSAARVLTLHGIALERVRAACAVSAEGFEVDSAIVAPSAFQNRRGVRVEGRWQRADARLDAGTYVVRLAQPLGVLATYVLDPRSDDGLVAWNIGARVANGRLAFDIMRLTSPLPESCALGSS